MIWEIVWSIVLGVVIGIIVSGITLLFIELWKENRIRSKWLLNLFIELNDNKTKKVQELKMFYNEIQYTDNIKNIDFINDFKCDFSVYQSLLINGINIGEDILFDYSTFITIEGSAYKVKKEYITKYLSLPPKGNLKIAVAKRKRIKNYFRSFTLPKLIRNFELQLIEIDKIFRKVSEMLIKSKLLDKNRIQDSSKTLRLLVMSYIGDKEDKII